MAQVSKYSYTERKRVRKSFGSRENVLEIPYLLQMQKDAYTAFLQADLAPKKRAPVGLQAAFESAFPIVSHNGFVEMKFVEYNLAKPGFDVRECQTRGLTFASAVRAVIATEGHRLADAETFEEMLAHSPADIVEVDEDHPAVYMFTSGTAGSPKAAVLTHGNLLSNISQTNSAERLGPGDVVFGVLPVHHIFGLNVVVGLTLAVGASVVLVQRFDPVSAMETIAERAVTVIPGAPSMWIALAQLDHPSRETFASVRLALSGASKLPEHTAQSLDARFGLKVREGYGLTEASPVVTSSVGTDWFPGSVGVPVPGCEVRVVDEDAEDVLVGDTGEIWVRGPNVFAGYLDDAEATARVLTPDGWLRTGDIGVIDDDGRLFIVDRAKDLIIVSGFNVFPAEVEAAINLHPDVVESTVIGTAHPHTGEAVRAYVVLRPGVHLDEDALIDHCRGRLARYKCPSKVLYVDSLPRNLVGKVQRYALR